MQGSTFLEVMTLARGAAWINQSEAVIKGEPTGSGPGVSLLHLTLDAVPRWA